MLPEPLAWRIGCGTAEDITRDKLLIARLAIIEYSWLKLYLLSSTLA
jgi:hypothetical protein